MLPGHGLCVSGYAVSLDTLQAEHKQYIYRHIHILLHIDHCEDRLTSCEPWICLHFVTVTTLPEKLLS